MSGISFFVLDVPEFEPVVRIAVADGLTVRRCGDHLELSTEAPTLVLRRAGSGIGTAVWHACLTGGLDGHIVAFSGEEIHLAQRRHG